MNQEPRPLIGIPCHATTDANGLVRYDMLATYVRALDRAGGAPALLPLDLSPESLDALYEKLDGLLLAGGVDVHPGEYGEEVQPYCGEIHPARDRMELALTRRALQDDKPVFGICRGIQLLNVAGGGSLYQDISSQVSESGKHDNRLAEASVRAHDVEIESDSRVSKALGTTRLEVNSLHHQAVKEVAPGLRVTARAPDGVVEAIESSEKPFVLGVQFHPEWLVDEDARMIGLFAEFVACAADFRRKHGGERG